MKLMWHNYLIINFSCIALQVLSVTSNNIKDFGNMGHLAKKWGEKVFHEWAWNQLTSSEIVAISKYTYKDYHQINKYLQVTKGQLVKHVDELDKNYNCAYLNKKIKLIESGLKKVKMPETLMIYRRIDETFFGFKRETLRDAAMKVKINLIETIKQNYLHKQFINYGFLSASLINEPRHISFNYYDYPILMAIKVPQNIHGAYLGDAITYYKDECEVLINRNCVLKYQNFTIIEEFNSETLKINLSIE